VLALETAKHPMLGKDAGVVAGLDKFDVLVTDEPVTRPDVLIDFSVPKGAQKALKYCFKNKVPLVVSTTGLSKSLHNQLKTASRRIPVLQSPNMSIGVNLLFELVEQAARALGDPFDVEIIDIHHRFKKDAPSGTALAIVDKIAKVRGIKSKEIKYGRHGEMGVRPQKEIGVGSALKLHTARIPGARLPMARFRRLNSW
jgi:4-hydroxy-tetrahydrodipicolinate reductase